MQENIIRRVKIQFPGGMILEFRNAQFIPAFYFIPECFLLKCGSELCSIPRDFNELIMDEEALKLVQSDLFVLCIVDCYAYMAWPYLCPKIPYMEIFSGDSPAWRIAHSAVTWIDELTLLKLLPTFEDLFSKPKDDLYFGFVPEETVSLYMSIAVSNAVKRHNLQPILDAEKEYRCFEDFNNRRSNQRIDFYRKWYHTRSKKAEFSLEGYKEHLMEVYGDHGWEVADPLSNFEDEVAENVDAQKFLSTLSENDRNILQLRQDGYTLQEIADKLGYKTHSAVLKRINSIGQKYEKYSGLNFGFQRMI